MGVSIQYMHACKALEVMECMIYEDDLLLVYGTKVCGY